MPDLVTHMASGLLAGSFAPRPQYTPALVVGSCLPDILGRVPAYIMTFVEYLGVMLPEEIVYGCAFMHLPIGLLISGALLVLFSPKGNRMLLWILLMLGSGIHLLLDALQHHWGEAYMWLFPLSEWSWEAGLIGSEATVYLAPFLLFGTYGLWRRRHSGQPWIGRCSDSVG